MASSKLPIPPEQLHYADPAVNDEAQQSPIQALVDRIHYPTIGCPALLTPEQELEVILSLPDVEDPAKVEVSLVDRHGGGGAQILVPAAAAEPLGLGPEGKSGRRQAWRLSYPIDAVPHRLFDLRAAWFGGTETQPNAVRIYDAITGREKVALCGDSQYHARNAACLERFIEKMNARDDIAWIALIGDLCDNNVVSELHVLQLALGARPGPVTCHYSDEYHHAAAQLLPRLNKPIVLVPGNHDGMVAYESYEPGAPTSAYLGPDPKNVVAYDGLHHFRRSVGPLYHSFDWGKTRWLCLSSFELDRHDRLGYHAVVANWGGWMRREQLDWLKRELEEATAREMRVVALVHHDPRGGSLGKDLGYYHSLRCFDCSKAREIVVGYMRYLGHNAFRWQQEWMSRPSEDMARHPVRELLSLLLASKTWAVVMGHDNENWAESYFGGDDIFVTEPRKVEYPASKEQVDPNKVKRAAEHIEDNELEKLGRMLEGDPNAHLVLEEAIGRLDAKDWFRPELTFAPDAVKAWDLRARAPIHFAHVNDIGAYKHSKPEHFRAYGYVVAALEEGRPVTLQSVDLAEGVPGETVELMEE